MGIFVNTPWETLRLIGVAALIVLTLVVAGLLQLALHLVRTLWRLAQAPADIPADHTAQKPPPDLASDPELLRFFARVDPTFRRQHLRPRQRPIVEPSPLAAPPQVIAERPEPRLLRADPDPMPLPANIRDETVQLYTSPMMDEPLGNATPAAKSAPAAAPTDAQLEAITKMWPLLSADDRRELFQIALLKVKRRAGK